MAGGGEGGAPVACKHTGVMGVPTKRWRRRREAEEVVEARTRGVPLFYIFLFNAVAKDHLFDGSVLFFVIVGPRRQTANSESRTKTLG